MAKTHDTNARQANSNEASAKVTQKVAPLKIETFGGDTVGFCDPETGECTVPNPVAAARTTDGQRKKPVSAKRQRP